MLRDLRRLTGHLTLTGILNDFLGGIVFLGGGLDGDLRGIGTTLSGSEVSKHSQNVLNTIRVIYWKERE